MRGKEKNHRLEHFRPLRVCYLRLIHYGRTTVCKGGDSSPSASMCTLAAIREKKGMSGLGLCREKTSHSEGSIKKCSKVQHRQKRIADVKTKDDNVNEPSNTKSRFGSLGAKDIIQQAVPNSPHHARWVFMLLFHPLRRGEYLVRYDAHIGSRFFAGQGTDMRSVSRSRDDFLTHNLQRSNEGKQISDSVPTWV